MLAHIEAYIDFGEDDNIQDDVLKKGVYSLCLNHTNSIAYFKKFIQLLNYLYASL